MIINPVFHARSKHIELDYYFVRERVALGLLVTQHISTEKQVTDLFTKPMSKAALSKFQTIDTQDKVMCNENKNYAMIQNKEEGWKIQKISNNEI